MRGTSTKRGRGAGAGRRGRGRASSNAATGGGSGSQGLGRASPGQHQGHAQGRAISPLVPPHDLQGSTSRRRASVSSQHRPQHLAPVHNIIHPSARSTLRTFSQSQSWRTPNGTSTSDTEIELSPHSSCVPMPSQSQSTPTQTFLQSLHTMPPSYAVHALRPIARRSFVGPFPCEIMPCEKFIEEGMGSGSGETDGRERDRERYKDVRTLPTHLPILLSFFSD